MTLSSVAAACAVCASMVGYAQLIDLTKAPNAASAGIAKSLDQGEYSFFLAVCLLGGSDKGVRDPRPRNEESGSTHGNRPARMQPGAVGLGKEIHHE